MTKTVLITSITGFLGANILDDLVKGGYKIKATVRDISRGKDAVAKYAGTSQPELIEIKDLIHGDLTEALKGVDAILHVASPYTFKITE
jgi:nucleoside-diphosphate-sugar epimerase